MKFAEYRQHDATSLAQLVRSKEVSTRDLAEVALAAVDAINPRINAVLETFDDECDEADRSGPLFGVPFLIKDLVLHRQGGLLEMGSRMARGLRAQSNTELMVRFRRAGLVTLGRTTTPEFGHGCTTESVATGPTRNPWDTNRMAGGSSGGSAAAVAARIVPLAHANDGAGSIRIPAGCCGLFGLKPTRGRVSLGPDIGEALFGMGIENAVSRSVRDAALLLDCIEGPSLGDPYEIERPSSPYRNDASQDPRSLNIAFSTRAWSGATIDTECASAVCAAAALCGQMGHRVEEASPQFSYEMFREACIKGWASAIVTWVDGLAQATGRKPGPGCLESATLAGYAYGRKLRAAELLGVPAAMNQIARSVAPFFARYDVLLTPTTARPAEPLGTYDQNAPGLTTEAWFDKKAAFAPFLALFNVTGQPAMTLPLAVADSGLPIGIHVAGRLGGEATLLRLAGQLERACPWAHREPSVAQLQAEIAI